MRLLFSQFYFAFIMVTVCVCVLTVTALTAGISSAVGIKKSVTPEERKKRITKTVVFLFLGAVGIAAAVVMILIDIFSHSLLSGRITV